MKTDLLKIYAKSNFSPLSIYIAIALIFLVARIELYSLPVEPEAFFYEVARYAGILIAIFLILMKTRDFYRKILSEKMPLRERDCTAITLWIAFLKGLYMTLWLYFLFMPVDSPDIYSQILGYAFIFLALGLYASVSAAYLPLFLWDVAVPLCFAGYILWLHRGMDETPYLAGTLALFAFYTVVNGLGITRTTRQLVESGYALKKAAAEANRANRSKSEFLAVMSHEIRTPMTGILGMVDFLAETGLSPEQESSLAAITECSKTLLNTLNDILDMSKIEAGKLVISNVNFDLHALLENTVKVLAPVAAEKNIQLTLDITDMSVPRFMYGDPHRIRQSVMNLVNNAIKFTETGGVTVSVSFGSGLIHIDVVDTGVGIHPAKMNLLFKSFSQADGSVARKFGGSGMGLYISKYLIEKMGGKIGVISAPGKGSTFWIDLPWREPVPEKKEAAGKAGARESKPLNILLVEDNRINQMVCDRLLTQKGHHVIVASDAKSAMEQVRALPFDIILMDCSLPDRSGFDVTREIRALGGKWQRLPIIALTANGMEDHIRRCTEAGMNDVIIKPYNPERLYNAIATFTATSVKAPVSKRFTTLQEEMGPEYTAHLVKAALEETSFLIHKLQKSLSEKNYDRLRQAAHELRAVAGSIGLQKTQGAAELIESACIREEIESLPKLVTYLAAAAENEKSALTEKFF